MQIALIGMMGCMKTSTAVELSKLTGQKYYDIDAIFVRENNMSISQAFEEHGEQFFRDKESEILYGLVQKGDGILSCGGGIILAEQNREVLKQCKVVHLKASSKAIYERIKKDKSRPLLAEMSVEKIESIYAPRRSIYKQVADIEIDTNKIYPKVIARKIMKNI